MSKNLEKSSKKLSKRVKSGNSTLQLYLFVYNFVQAMGWSYVLYLSTSYYLKNDGSKTSLFETVKWPIVIFQNLAILEVVHSIFKLVSSSPMITFAQIYSRVIVVAGVVIATPTAKQSVGWCFCVFAWSVTEIIRYLFYALNLVDKVPYFLIWLRYSTFYVLYPIGVTGELICYYAAQSYAAKMSSWNVKLFNVMFSYQYFLIANMICYIPMFPKMYLHLMKQRSKVLISNGQSKNK